MSELPTPKPILVLRSDQTERIRGGLSAQIIFPCGVQRRWIPSAPDDERPGAPGTAVISHALWHRRLAGDPELGKLSP